MEVIITGLILFSNNNTSIGQENLNRSAFLWLQEKQLLAVKEISSTIKKFFLNQAVSIFLVL